MYDFNPLASLFLLKALSAEFPVISFRSVLAKLTFRRPGSHPTPSIPEPNWHERAFTGPVHASHPSFNLRPPADADIPTRP